jgi:hypothetical protein
MLLGPRDEDGRTVGRCLLGALGDDAGGVPLSFQRGEDPLMARLPRGLRDGVV